MAFDPERRLRGQQRVSVTIRREERALLDPLADRVRQRGLAAMLHRAAILHTDVVTQAADLAAQAGATSSSGPLRWSIGDGTGRAAEGLNLHWELARMLLAAATPDPRRDPFVRDWYRATVAIGQAVEYFDVLQIGEGLRLFPDDPELLLLKGAEREAMASPLFQAFARSIGPSLRSGIGSVGRELDAAADFYRRALAADPQLAEARIRLGRVLGLQGRAEEAVRELESALAADLDSQHRYFALLFLGAAREGLGQPADAVQAFEQAARAEGARVPHLAIARLAREHGDRAQTTASLERALAPLTRDAAIDPWWLYHSAQGRRRAPWLDDLRRRAREDRP
jgi:tetratricopeptide (TPR) repeat protein